MYDVGAHGVRPIMMYYYSLLIDACGANIRFFVEKGCGKRQYFANNNKMIIFVV
jgi:hypothetical protein